MKLNVYYKYFTFLCPVTVYSKMKAFYFSLFNKFICYQLSGMLSNT